MTNLAPLLDIALDYRELLRNLARRPAQQVVPLVAMLGLCWQESGENPAIFCYRMCWALGSPLRHLLG